MLNLPQRNPRLTIRDKTIQTIGDVHLGREYTNGVPLNMRGHMEKKQRDKFEALLAISDCDYRVLVGDIFDSFIVDPTDVDFAANAILAAASAPGSPVTVLLGGNHDESKDLTRKSSFDNLKLALTKANVPGLHVVNAPTIIDRMGFVSWSARYSAKELAEQLIQMTEAQGIDALDAVFGHWDINLPSHANHYNMVPTKQLGKLTAIVVTGHDHKPKMVERDDITITVTGSVIPLAHGEELESDELFYTLTIKDYEADPKRYAGKAVRFVLAEDEVLPDADFAQVKAYTKPTTDVTDSEPETSDFDPATLLTAFLTKEGLDDTRVAEVVERFKERNAE